MKGILVSPDEEIVVNLVLALTKDGKIIAEDSAENVEKMYSEIVDVNTIEEHRVVFRKPSFKDHVNMNKNLFNTTDGSSVDFNPLEVRLARMSSLLKSWTLKDSEGNPLSPTVKNVENLHPIIAGYLGGKLDEEVGSI